MISRVVALLCLILVSPLYLTISLYIMIVDGCPILHCQKRPGLNHELFNFYKFRSMAKNTPEVATHLLEDAKSYLIPGGAILRKYSLDEIPNLLNILKGEMAFIGPRPALHNQQDLIKLRELCGIDKLKPGITGWAQVNGRDDLSVKEKVKYDRYYLQNKGFRLNLAILFKTTLNVIGHKNISH